MKAVRINQWGQPYQIEDVSQPIPGNDEVLVRVHAASVNPVDSSVAAGYLQAMVSVPMTAGTDFAGEVVSVGADVTHVKPGDAVYGMIPIRGGAFAEYATPKAKEVGHKPTSLDYTQASAVPLPAMAAWQCVFELAQLQAAERVLIHGAGGAVGSLAVQLAKNLGAYVIASDIAAKGGVLRELGADQIIDAQAERFEEVIEPVDVVLNFATDELVQRSYSVLKSGGRYVTTLQQPPQEEAERLGIRTASAFAQPNPDLLDQVAGLIDDGKLKVWVSEVFPLDEAQAALERRQTSTTLGKIVLTVG
jgi:NADPH:quinone reductase-like Zn-dependent oxidoreductase